MDARGPAGAVSFLLKDAAPETVVEAITSAAAGEARFSPVVLRRLVELAGATDQLQRRSATTRPPSVSVREWEVAQAIARGLTNQEVADALHVSVATVKTRLARLYEKFGITNRVQLAIRVLGAHQEAGER